MATGNFIEFHHITRTFPGVVALSDVSFGIQKGEIHALVGENGAGKSTLINICSGILPQDRGYLVVNGQEVQIGSAKEADRFRIATVFQEVPVCSYMTIAQNIFLGPRPLSKLGFLNSRSMNRETEKLLAVFNIKRHPSELMANLSLPEQSMVQILRAVHTRPDFLILDEPTSALSLEQKDMLFGFLGSIRRERELTILYVSHRLEEVFEITNRISVLKDGRFMGTVNTRETDVDTIIRMMVGREINKEIYDSSKQIGEVVFEIKSLSRGDVLKDISFTIRKGEILGLAGLQGAGRTELGRAMAGADKIDAGEIVIRGKTAHIRTVRQAIKAGIAMIPENRREEGIVPVLTVRDNLILASLDRVSRFGYFVKKRIKKMVHHFTERMNIKLHSPQQRIDSLSGGNQQKVIIARWLASQPKLLICDEPTRGIDVGSKSEIHSIIVELAKNGLSVLLISSEMPELLSISDRILVMHEGRLTGELDHDEATEEKIMYMATAG